MHIINYDGDYGREDNTDVPFLAMTITVDTLDIKGQCMQHY